MPKNKIIAIVAVVVSLIIVGLLITFSVMNGSDSYEKEYEGKEVDYPLSGTVNDSGMPIVKVDDNGNIMTDSEE